MRSIVKPRWSVTTAGDLVEVKLLDVGHEGSGVDAAVLLDADSTCQLMEALDAMLKDLGFEVVRVGAKRRK